MPDVPAATPDAVPPRPKARGKSVVVAAGLTAALASVGLAIALASRPGSSAAPRLSTEAQLAASAMAVAARHPDLKAEVEPLSAVELRAIEPQTSVAGVWLLDPVGWATTERPTIRWARLAGTPTYDVEVVPVANGAKAVWTGQTTEDSLSFPAHGEPLVAGVRYRVSVRVPDARPEASGSAEFQVLPVPHRTTWRTLVGDVESNEPASIRDLYVAHLALREGLFAEALRRASAWSASHAGDPAARPLLEAAARAFRLGPDAPAPFTNLATR